MADAPTRASILRDAKATLKAGPAGIRAKQLERLQAMVDHARASSPLYTQHYKGVPQRITEVRQLPPVTRAQLQGNFDAWVTDRSVTKAEALRFAADKSLIGQAFHGKYALWTTSGVTGEPGIFLQDEHALRTYQGLVASRLVLRSLGVLGALKLRLRGARMAVVFATGHHFGGIGSFYAYMRLDPSLRKSVRIIAVQNPIKQIVAELNDVDPAFLVGYTNSLLELGKEKRAGRLKIRPLMVLSGGEGFDPAAYAQMTEDFGCVVRDAYGATECICLGYSCDEGWLHVNADWAIVEPVELDYSATPPGQVSRTTLVTNLVNHLQPLIRYDIGDRTMLKPDPCACGNPLPALKVEGRRDEVLTFLSPTGEKVVVVPKAIIGVIEQVVEIEKYQFIQTGAASVDLRLAAVPGANLDTAWQDLEQRLTKFLHGQGLRVTLRRAPDPPHQDPKTGKFLHIWATPEAKAAVAKGK